MSFKIPSTSPWSLLLFLSPLTAFIIPGGPHTMMRLSLSGGGMLSASICLFGRPLNPSHPSCLLLSTA